MLYSTGSARRATKICDFVYLDKEDGLIKISKKPDVFHHTSGFLIEVQNKYLIPKFGSEAAELADYVLNNLRTKFYDLQKKILPDLEKRFALREQIRTRLGTEEIEDIQPIKLNLDDLKAGMAVYYVAVNQILSYTIIEVKSQSENHKDLVINVEGSRQNQNLTVYKDSITTTITEKDADYNLSINEISYFKKFEEACKSDLQFIENYLTNLKIIENYGKGTA